MTNFRHQVWLLFDPEFIFRDDLGACSVFADNERIAPDARPPDVDAARNWASQSFLVEHSRIVRGDGTVRGMCHVDVPFLHQPDC